MKIQTRSLIFAILTTTLFAATVMADEAEVIVFSDELDACVTALNEKIDLEGVHRIRHIVTNSDTKGSGYQLTIQTQTFSKTVDKRYAVDCIARGKNEPSRLKVSEIST